MINIDIVALHLYVRSCIDDREPSLRIFGDPLGSVGILVGCLIGFLSEFTVIGMISEDLPPNPPPSQCATTTAIPQGLLVIPQTPDEGLTDSKRAGPAPATSGKSPPPCSRKKPFQRSRRIVRRENPARTPADSFSGEQAFEHSPPPARQFSGSKWDPS